MSQLKENKEGQDKNNSSLPSIEHIQLKIVCFQNTDKLDQKINFISESVFSEYDYLLYSSDFLSEVFQPPEA